MTESNLVTVIVTCFNQERWIEAAVRSVLSQKCCELECVVVDDGSSDGSAGIVQRLAAEDCRVRLVQQSNQGVSAARNTGYRQSQGRFIQFLDGDDLLKAGKLARHLQHFSEQPETDVSWCEHEYLDERTGKTARYPQCPIARQPLQQLLFEWFDGVSLPIHAAVFRRSLWAGGEVPFSETYRDRCEDWVFLVSVALKSAVFSGVPDVLCVYRLGVSGFTTSAIDWNTAALRAAFEIAGLLPAGLRDEFLGQVLRRTLDRCVRLQKPLILRESLNWRIGYYLTRPFYLLSQSVLRVCAVCRRQQN
jgi:glycosyltransferase involved in cell wall biosynthesis